MFLVETYPDASPSTRSRTILQPVSSVVTKSQRFLVSILGVRMGRQPLNPATLEGLCDPSEGVDPQKH